MILVLVFSSISFPAETKWDATDKKMDYKVQFFSVEGQIEDGQNALALHYM